MQPLLKWPGGKSSEIEYIKDIIPSYDRYIEPFCGGGAVYFYLEPNKAVINDISKNLTDFYMLIKELLLILLKLLKHQKSIKLYQLF